MIKLELGRVFEGYKGHIIYEKRTYYIRKKDILYEKRIKTSYRGIRTPHRAYYLLGRVKFIWEK